ncbi:hypothetical protein KCP74_06520 [Salmonella enterica subsp. enterica]|nr:hypothetical protein KCP74_06520 [Salmonella enterica subsp. enterica]
MKRLAKCGEALSCRFSPAGAEIRRAGWAPSGWRSKARSKLTCCALYPAAIVYAGPVAIRAPRAKALHRRAIKFHNLS